MKKFAIILTGFFLVVANYPARAQNEMFKALYMYNFTKNIDWPKEYREGNFIIGVLGNSPIVTELSEIAKKKKVIDQAILVKKFASVAKIEDCHILYIPTTKSSLLPQVLAKFKGKPTLIITDAPGLAKQGSMINYVTVRGDQKFEINVENFEPHGLKVNNFLVSLGIKVN